LHPFDYAQIILAPVPKRVAQMAPSLFPLAIGARVMGAVFVASLGAFQKAARAPDQVLFAAGAIIQADGARTFDDATVSPLMLVQI
jgi:hypothetical protein